MKKLLLLIVTIIVSLETTAQIPKGSFTRYSNKNGLPVTVIQDICQDRDGYLWLGTWSGIYRFDGKQFVNYNISKNGNSKDDLQISNRVIDINDDSAGNLIILSYDNAIYKLNKKQVSIDRISPPEFAATHMFKINDNSLLFVSDSNKVIIAKYEEENDTYRFGKTYSLPLGAHIYHIRTDRDGVIWAMTDAGLFKNFELFSDLPAFELSSINGSLYFGSSDGQIIKIDNGKLSIIKTEIKSDIKVIKKVSDNFDILIGSDLALYTYNLATTEIKYAGKAPGLFDDLICKTDINDNIWLYSKNGGLYWFDKKNKRVETFLNKSLENEWNDVNNVTAFYPDQQGNLWIGASWGGLERVTLIKDMFHIHSFTSSSSASLKNSVRAIFQDKDGFLYAATRNNLIHVFDKRFREIKTYNTPGPVYSITQSQDGKLWFGMKTGGLMSINRNSAKNGADSIEIYKKTDSFYGLVADKIYALKEDSENKLWIGSLDNGLSYLNLNNNNRFFISKRNRISFPTDKTNSIRTIKFSQSGNMYAGGKIGLFMCANPLSLPEEMKFEWFVNLKSGYDIQNIMFSRSNQMFVSTSGSGFLCFEDNTTDSKFKAFTESDGLLSNIVRSSIEDYDGNIWIATFGGLNRYNPSTGKIIGYSYDRLGLNSMILDEGEPVMGVDSTLYFNTNSGVLHFNPRDISNSSYTPKIIVLSCLCSGAIVDAESEKGIVMKSDDNLSFDFLAIDMAGQEEVTYSYMLEGRDSDWIFLGSNGEIKINKLRRGNYSLKVRSTNADGIQVMNERSFSIKVRSASQLAGILLALLLLGGIATLQYLHSKRNLAIINKSLSETEEDEYSNYSPEDRNFILTLRNYLESNLSDTEIGVDNMAEQVHLSRSAFFNKCKQVLNKTPIEYLRDLRLKKAIELIDSGEHTISEAAFMSGFNDSHYFSRVFRKQYEMSPSEYKSRRPS